MLVKFLALCYFALVSSFIVDDVPVAIWSSSHSLEKEPVDDSITETKLVSMVNGLIEKSNPELVVLFHESQLRTFEVSLFNSESSVFSVLKDQIKSKNGVVIPYGDIDHTLIGNLASSRKFNGGSILYYFTGEVDKSKTVINSLEELNGHSILSNGKTDLLIVKLNKKQLSLDEHFLNSGEIMKSVLKALKDTNHIVVYTGNSYDELENTYSEKFATHNKRDESFINMVYQNISNSTFANITGISWFNYWFPGWFWGIGSVIFVFGFITLFGLYQLLTIPITEKITAPKSKQKSH